jgi:HEAT repeat protein
MKISAIALLFVVATLGNPCAAQTPAPKSNTNAVEKPLGVWIEGLKSPNYKARKQAAEAIARLGPQAKAAVPALYAAMIDKEVRGVPNYAGAALWKVDREMFTRLLNDTAPTPEARNARWVAVLSLPLIGSDAKDLAPLVLKMAADERDRNHAELLFALGYIGADPGDVLPALRAGLQNELHQTARIMSASALGNMGEKARDALPALHDALKDEDPQVRVESARAIWGIARDHKTAVPVLKDALAGAARQRAIAGLGDVGEAAKDAFPALLDFWKREDDRTLKGMAANALLAIDAKAAATAGVKRSNLP